MRTQRSRMTGSTKMAEQKPRYIVTIGDGKNSEAVAWRTCVAQGMPPKRFFDTEKEAREFADKEARLHPGEKLTVYGALCQYELPAPALVRIEFDLPVELIR